MLTAIYKNDLARVQMLCESNKISLDIKYRPGTALVVALKLQKKEIADYLISKMTIESLRLKEHKEAIVLAALDGYFDILSILCDADVDLDIEYQKLTALVVALKFQKKEIADYLISKMTSESLRLKEHKEAIVFASLHGYYDIVSILCDLGVNLNLSFDN